MRIVQFYEQDRIRVGSVDDRELLTPLDFQGDMMDFILSSRVCGTAGSPRPLGEIRLAPPLNRPGKIIGIGRNYLEHIREAHRDVPKAPMIFTKFPTTLIAHEEAIHWNRHLTNQVDFEAELAVIIGKKACRCPEGDAMEIVFGYTCANDVSARDLQYGDGHWVRGKSLDTFCPLGPWIVTQDEVPDPHTLAIKSHLNGVRMQDSNTGKMIFKIPYLISYLSESFTLLPGDIILTGTPHGVGVHRDPPLLMKDGDRIVVDIESIGRLENVCRAL